MQRFVYRSRYATPKELYSDPLLTESEKLMMEPLLLVFDCARELHGGPLRITSGRRTQKKQDELIKQGYRAAKLSAHTYGAAIDIAVPGTEDMYLLELIAKAAATLGLERPRIGVFCYRPGLQKCAPFIHVDYAFLLDIPNLPPSWKKVGLIF